MLTFHDCRAPQAVELSHRAREITVETRRDPLAVQVYVWREKGGKVGATESAYLYLEMQTPLFSLDHAITPQKEASVKRGFRGMKGKRIRPIPLSRVVYYLDETRLNWR